ncbi:MAG: teichoic acid biosynthesis protein [Clostridia bacterium]|nr:teichoic acid biosynthesis protein [Deltaproteobacteria bacterium]
MRLLYGVVGEGMGHAMRSRVILTHLMKQGHEVAVMASGRAVEFLQKHFPDVRRIHGLHIIYDENQVKLGRTLWSNVLHGVAAVPKQIAAYFDLIDEFKPQGVISDFESWTYWYAKTHRLPIISIDNMQVLNRCKHPREVIRGYGIDFELARAFVKSKLPFCDHYLVSSFFLPPVHRKRTTIVPPILRDEILGATSSRGDHVLVYQTAEGNAGLADTLTASGAECRVYGMRRGIEEEQVEGNLRYRPFSESAFVDDLASSKAVIAGGGFTLMGECVYLHKPVLSVPVGGQFEQVLNARWLERLGYGKFAPALDDSKIVHSFLANVPRHEEALAGYVQDGNNAVTEVVDQHLDAMAAFG